jgi:hypothetical protein
MEESMRLALPTLFVVLASSGCANQQLRFSTLRQTSTLADIQEIQVIENFARLASNPGALPYFAVANGGNATVTDEGMASVAVTAVHRAFPSWDVTPLNASRTIAENWTLAPLNNPDRLMAMRAAYLSVLNPSLVDPDELAKLNAVLAGDRSYTPRPGWIGIGGRWDVPKDACKVGHCGHVYVWVPRSRSTDFTRFVLLILNVASVTSSGGTAPAAYAPEALPSGFPFAPRLFDQPPAVNSGLFFVPRR